MELSSVNMQVIEEGIEIKTHFLVRNATFVSIADLNYAINNMFNIKVIAEDKPETVTEPEPEVDADTVAAAGTATAMVEGISDTQLLQAVSKVAEKVGADKAKEIVKKFAVGRGRPTVKNIPHDKRVEFIETLKTVMTTVVETTGEVPEVEVDSGGRDTDSRAPASTGSRRRRN